MSNKSEKLTLDAPELAKVLGICKPRAYELMKQKDFPSIQISERRFIVPPCRAGQVVAGTGKPRQGGMLIWLGAECSASM